MLDVFHSLVHDVDKFRDAFIYFVRSTLHKARVGFGFNFLSKSLETDIER
jgi:hypothetical protein